jgi:hypothetical protein
LGSVGQRDITLHLEDFHWPNADLSELDQIFLEEEIWSTIKSLPPDKALGWMDLLAGSMRLLGK